MNRPYRSNPTAKMTETCPINIGPKQRRRRIILGILMFLGSAALAIFLLGSEFPHAWRFFLFFPFYLSMLGFLQAKAKTCVALAFQGTRNLDHGSEKVSETEAGTLRLQGRKVLIKAAFFSAVLTAICYFL